jgi:PAS domain S-box-containing protein
VPYLFLKSIRAHLLFLVLISIIPALGIILYSGLTQRNHSIRDAEGQALAALHGLVAEQERTVESSRQLLKTLSKLEEVRNQDAVASELLLKELLKENPIYTNLLIANKDGMLISSALPSTRHSIADRKYFRDTARTRDFSAGEYIIGSVSKRPVIHFAYPIFDKDGRLTGIVAAAVNVVRYGEMFAAANPPENSVMNLSDYKGIRLFRYPEPEKYVGKADYPERIARMRDGASEGTFAGTGRDGTRRLFAYKRFHLKGNPAPYLFMRVGVSEKRVLAEARRVLFFNLALFGIAFLIAVVSALVIGKAVVVNKLDALVEASRRLGKGDPKARTGLTHGEDEFGHLAGAFDEMADDLERKEEERKQAEAALTTQFHFLQNIIDTIPNAVFYKDTNGLYQGCNKAFQDYVGLPKERIVGKTVFEVHPKEYADTYHERDVNLFANPSILTYEAVIRHCTGETRDVIMSKATYSNAEGKVAGLIGAMVDITERRQAEESLKSSLREKEVLLKEIHHRVKNNLQVISSLLSLQSRYEKDNNSENIFRESIDRIKTMANIHALLYQSRDYARIDFSRFITDLANQLYVSYDPNRESAALVTHIKDVSLDIDTAIPCGLVLNELVSNAMKYAFPNGKRGEITISMSSEEGRVTLMVSDNGIGFPEELDFRNTESLGMQLVTELVEQLDGTIELIRDGGTEFRIVFAAP